MQRLARAEVQRLTERVPDLLRVMETVLGSVFDEQGYQWSERKLRVGAAMSAVELASHSRLEKRRALWHASMVLMTLKDIDGDPDTAQKAAYTGRRWATLTLEKETFACGQRKQGRKHDGRPVPRLRPRQCDQLLHKCQSPKRVPGDGRSIAQPGSDQ